MNVVATGFGLSRCEEYSSGLKVGTSTALSDQRGRTHLKHKRP